MHAKHACFKVATAVKRQAPAYTCVHCCSAVVTSDCAQAAKNCQALGAPEVRTVVANLVLPKEVDKARGPAWFEPVSVHAWLGR